MHTSTTTLPEDIEELHSPLKTTGANLALQQQTLRQPTGSQPHSVQGPTYALRCVPRQNRFCVLRPNGVQQLCKPRTRLCQLAAF